MADVCIPALRHKEYEDFFDQFYEFLEKAQNSREELNQDLIPRAQELLHGNLKTFLIELGFGSNDFPEWISDNSEMGGDRSLIMEVVRASVAITTPLSKVFASRSHENFKEYIGELKKFLSVYREYAFAVSALDMMYRNGFPKDEVADSLGLSVPEYPQGFTPVAFNFYEDKKLESLAQKYYINYRAEKVVR